MKCLIYELGADVNVSADDGSLPLHIAACNPYIDAVIMLTDRRYAYERNKNMKDRNGCTPLHYASRNGSETMVRFLAIKLGVDVNVRDNYGITPLHLASQQGFKKVVNVLVCEARADIFLKNKKGQIPLDIAVENKHGDIVKILVKMSLANINVLL